MSLKNKNLFNSFLIQKLSNKILSKGKKKKSTSIIFNLLKNLKKRKLKPTFFFFLITFKKKITNKKKKKKITYKPIFLSIKQQYLVSIK